MEKALMRVLLVDDDEDDYVKTRSVLSRVEGSPYELHWVDSYDAGRERICAGGFGVCLLDFRLGERTGLELLREVGNGCGMPVILLTGQSEGGLDLDVLKAGAADYLRKSELTPALLDRSIRYAVERARVHRELQDSHAFLKWTLDALSAHIAILDPSGTVLGVNAAWRRFARENGFQDPGQGVGMNYLDVCATSASVGAADARAVADGIGEVIARRRTEFSLEYPCDSPTEQRWFVVRATRFESEGGDQVVLAHENITELKRAEEELRQREAELRQSQKLEAIGRLAGGIAHDFNNLLTVITGYSDIVLSRLNAIDPLRVDVLEIRNAGDRAAALTQQLLAFSRNQVLQSSVLDLNAVVASMERMLGRLIDESIDLVTKLDPALWRVNADPGKLEQVIANLVLNARDAMPKGGRLTICTANVVLDQDFARQHAPLEPGAYVTLSVRDTGSGMDAATRARIFEPFFTTKEKGKGTGLGLATVYGIVKQSGGYIWADSAAGKGTTFEIHLPRFEDEVVEAPQAKAQQEEVAGGDETILLVEDETGVRKFARRVLETLGYTVLEAESGSDALRVLELHPGCVTLLVTDVIMPKMSGRELVERLTPLYPDMKVLFMSGYTDDALGRHGVLDDGVALLEKPFSPEAMARKVRELIDAR